MPTPLCNLVHNGGFEVADAGDATLPLGWARSVSGSSQIILNTNGQYPLSVGYGVALVFFVNNPGETCYLESQGFYLPQGGSVFMHALVRLTAPPVAQEGFDFWLINATKSKSLQPDLATWASGTAAWYHGPAHISSAYGPSEMTQIKASAPVDPTFDALDVYKVRVGCAVTGAQQSGYIENVRLEAFGGQSLTRKPQASWSRSVSPIVVS